MQLFDNNYVTISLDDTVPCLEKKNKKYMSSEAFRDSETKSLNFYLQYKRKHPRLEWFVDARNVGAIPLEDTQWVMDEILPKFAAAGLTKEAFVVPTSAIGRVVVKDYEAKAGKRIQVKVFDSVEAAKNWLKK